MVKAIWNGEVIAESEHTVRLEGNHYFPADDVDHEYLSASDVQTTCSGRGSPGTAILKPEMASIRRQPGITPIPARVPR